jgi:hypothetical protein
MRVIIDTGKYAIVYVCLCVCVGGGVWVSGGEMTNIFLYVLTSMYIGVQVFMCLHHICMYVRMQCMHYLSNTLLIITSTIRKGKLYSSPGTTLHSEMLSKLISAHFRKLSNSFL